MWLGNSDRNIVLTGQTFCTGTYVLHIYAQEPLDVIFGRFQGGRAVRVDTGHYLYVGSAMGRSGSASLARRILRHATRQPPKPGHMLRPALVSRFQTAGLGPPNLRPPASKKLRWHIDYLLDELVVEIAQVFIVRSEIRHERPLAHRLGRLPGMEPLAKGLGASDDPGESHLFRDGDSIVWPELAHLLASLSQGYDPAG